jgi:hypothetical protein
MNPLKVILSHIGNFTSGRTSPITRGYFHRTAVQGDTAEGEGNYFHAHVVKASFYKVVDLEGNVVMSLPATDTEWATDEWAENLRSVNYEFTGLNGSALTALQISAVIADIKADPATKKIANYRLKLADIKGNTSGWGTHRDITFAYKNYGGHTDAISEVEIHKILLGIKG